MDVTVVTDYLEVIERPMDLGTVGKKLANGEYQTWHKFRVRGPTSGHGRAHMVCPYSRPVGLHGYYGTRARTTFC